MCKVDECVGGVYAKELCSMHYQRLRRYGRLEAIQPSRNPTGFCYQCGKETSKVYCSGRCASLATSTRYNKTEKGRESRQDAKYKRRSKIVGSGMKKGWKARLLALYPTCLVCGTDVDLTVDHVLPLSLGGKHEFDNLQTLCGHHNYVKGAKHIDYR